VADVGDLRAQTYMLKYLVLGGIIVAGSSNLIRTSG
jgi:hypothetical protein